MLSIENKTIPKVLLLGNGINRAYDFNSWDELIKSIQVRDLSDLDMSIIKNAPYPLQPVILTNDHVNAGIKRISPELSQLKAQPEERILLQKFAALPFDAVLTSNYTYEMENALKADFKCMPNRKCHDRMIAHTKQGRFEARQLHTYFSVGEQFPPIWHIHGEASRPDTMILGHYYYGKLLAKMQQYISPFIARYKARISRGLNVDIYSWLDYFLIGEVHIVGLGMSLSEFDLWWLVNCKKRHFPDRKVILYKGDIKAEEEFLAEAYGVIVNKSNFNGDYKLYYWNLCDYLRNSLESQRGKQE